MGQCKSCLRPSVKDDDAIGSAQGCHTIPVKGAKHVLDERPEPIPALQVDLPSQDEDSEALAYSSEDALSVETDGSAGDFLLSAQPSTGSVSDGCEAISERSSLELDLLSSAVSADSENGLVSKEGEAKSVSLRVRLDALAYAAPLVFPHPRRRTEQVPSLKVLCSEHRAATTIKRYVRVRQCRKAYARQLQAAVVLQAAVRARAARRAADGRRRENAAVLIQRCARGFLARKEYERMQQAAVVLQAVVRARAARRAAEDLRREHAAAVCIQAHVRGLLARKAYKRMQQAAIAIQSLARALQARRALSQQQKKREEAAVIIQSAYRAHVARRQYQATRVAAVTMQAMWRGRAAQQALESVRQASVTMQSYVRGRSARKAFAAQLAEAAAAKQAPASASDVAAPAPQASQPAVCQQHRRCDIAITGRMGEETGPAQSVYSRLTRSAGARQAQAQQGVTQTVRTDGFARGQAAAVAGAAAAAQPVTASQPAAAPAARPVSAAAGSSSAALRQPADECGSEMHTAGKTQNTSKGKKKEAGRQVTEGSQGTHTMGQAPAPAGQVFASVPAPEPAAAAAAQRPRRPAPAVQQPQRLPVFLQHHRPAAQPPGTAAAAPASRARTGGDGGQPAGYRGAGNGYDNMGRGAYGSEGLGRCGQGDQGDRNGKDYGGGHSTMAPQRRYEDEGLGDYGSKGAGQGGRRGRDGKGGRGGQGGHGSKDGRNDSKPNYYDTMGEGDYGY